jgi:hypothetical protein
VRIEAVNALKAALSGAGAQAAAAQDPRVEQVLRHCVQNDSNHYVRLTAAATLKQIAANQAAPTAP